MAKTRIKTSGLSANISVGNLTLTGTTSVSGNIVPTSNNAMNLGTPTLRFGSLYLSGNTIDLGGTQITTTTGGDLSFNTNSGNIAITANTVSFLSTVANTTTTTGNVAFTANLTAEAIYADRYFYSNGTAYYNTGYTGSAGSAGTSGSNGYTGSAGSAGAAGYTGSSGSAGAAGYTGSGGSIGYTGSRGTDGTAGGGYLNLLMPGAITAPLTGTARFYPPASMTVNTVYANLSANPTNGNLTFVIKKNGTSIGTTFTLSSALMNAVSTSISLTTTDYLTVDVTGSAMGSDLHIKLKYI